MNTSGNEIGESPTPKKLPKKRLTFLSVGVLLFALLLLLALSPSLFSQTTNGQQSTEVPNTFYFEMMRDVFQFISRNYVDKVDPQVLYNGAIRGMFEALKDPHTAYLEPEDLRSLTDTTTGEFGGVGMYIDKQRNAEGQLVQDGYVEVVSPIEGTPAFRAGMLSGDLIVEIDGVNTSTLSTDEAVSKLRGKTGTAVQIRVFRGKSIDFKVSLERQNIEIPTVRYAMIGDVAYIRLIQFTPLSAERMKEAFNALKKENYKALILDLRNNPGGVLEGAIEIGDQFFSDGKIVSTKGRNPNDNSVNFANPGQLIGENIPIVCLINGGSASASEILAGALKDRGRAVFVGEKSYGKGSVQIFRGLGDHGFRLTVARYYTPADISIDKIGISPDIEVKEAPLTREEELSYIKLREMNLVAAFIESKIHPNAQEIAGFIKDLASKGINLPERIVRRLIQREIERKTNTSSVYDLENDLVLQKALELIKQGSVESIIQSRPKTAPAISELNGLPLPKSQ